MEAVGALKELCRAALNCVPWVVGLKFSFCLRDQKMLFPMQEGFL